MSPDDFTLGRQGRSCHSIRKMTLSARRIILITLFIPAVAAVLIAAAVWILWAKGIYAVDYQTPSLTAVWWSMWRPAEITDLLWAMGGITFLAVFPVVGEAFLRRSFRRSPSPEVFFFRIFMLTLPFNVFRLLIPEVSSGTVPATWGLMATRIVWFARFFGFVALLNIGAFAADIPFRRSGSILGMGTLAAIVIAAMLPLDITQPVGNLLYREGTETSLALSCIVMEILAVLCLTGVSASRANPRYYMLSASLLIIIFGADLLFFVSSPLILPGAVALIIGFMLFVGQIRKIYQWL